MSAYRPERPPTSDVGNALIARVAAEDQRAMEDFYCGYQSTVYRFAAAQVPDAFAAAELLNEVMLDVWRGAARKPAKLDPLVWVLALTHRAAQRLAAPSPSGFDPLPQRAAADGAAAEAALRRDHRLLDVGMSRLSCGLRAALHLALVEDLPLGIVAAVLGGDERDVRKALRDASAQLRYSLSQASP